jgi:hypothetical protein
LVTKQSQSEFGNFQDAITSFDDAVEIAKMAVGVKKYFMEKSCFDRVIQINGCISLPDLHDENGIHGLESLKADLYRMMTVFCKNPKKRMNLFKKSIEIWRNIERTLTFGHSKM